MPPADEITYAEHLEKIPPTLRPTVEAVRRTVKTVAPGASEIAYQSQPPSSSRAMWKLVRYAVHDTWVVGIGTYPTYATLFFYRGRELDEGDGLLEGSGKDMRFIRLHEPADAEGSSVKRLVRRAFKLGDHR